MININKVKCCPFCGQKPTVEQWTEFDRAYPLPEEYDCISISCCGIKMYDISIWNNRAPAEPHNGLKFGQYCLASAWKDEDPNDPWSIGFLHEILYTKFTTYYKLKGENVDTRWFRHCRPISEEEAKVWLNKEE